MPTIPGLPNAATVASTDTIPVVQEDGVLRNATVQQFLASSVAGTHQGYTPLGAWDADTNTPTLSDDGGGGSVGDSYFVSVAGSTAIDGTSTWEVGDLVVNTGEVWQRIPWSAVLGTMSVQNADAVDVTGGGVSGLSVLGVRSTGASYDLKYGSNEALTATRTLFPHLRDADAHVVVPNAGHLALKTDIDRRVAASSGLIATAGLLHLVTDANGSIIRWTTPDGIEHHVKTDGPRRYLAPSPDIIPIWGIVDDDGNFLGFDRAGQLHGKIDTVYDELTARIGPAPTPKTPLAGVDPNLGQVTIDADGHALTARTLTGAPVDYEEGRRPAVGTSWLASDGTPVAPFTTGARECVVALVPNVGLITITPYNSGYHWLFPRLAYGDRSVIAWRYAHGADRSTAEPFCVSLDGSGFAVPELPDTVFVFSSDSQSLGVGSHGVDQFLITHDNYPEHTLTLNNTTIPGDIRLGRTADDLDFVLDANTLGDFCPISAQVGDPTNLGFTPVEGLLLTLQAKIVRKLGRPQRMCAFAMGIGGATIAQLGAGTANRTNLETAMTAVVAAATARGWNTIFAAHSWIQGESDATSTEAVYGPAFDDYVDEVRAIADGLTGTMPKVLCWSISSFGEAADNETTSFAPVVVFLDRSITAPDKVCMVGPHYPEEAYYYDYVHMLMHGYLNLGEYACETVVRNVWGVGDGDPLYIKTATYDSGGPTITLTWSRPVTQDTTLVPAQTNDGIEVAYASGSFETIASHDFGPDDDTTTITLAGTIDSGHLPTITVQVGMLGQDTVRDQDSIPRTNIRALAAHDNHELDHVEMFRWACHQRKPLD